MTGDYTHGHHASVLRAHGSRTAATSAAYLLPHLRPGTSLLDVGCGPGTITADLALAVAPARVVGIDASEAPLVQARQLETTAEFSTGDVYDLGYEDGAFDVVHAHQVLQHLTDPVAALREMRRVSAALVAVRDADYETFTWWPAEPRLDRWLDLYRRLARHNGAEPDAGRHLTTWAAEAGFTRVDGSATAWCYTSSADRVWWAETWAERVVESAYAEQALAAGLADAAELTDLAAGWRAWGRERHGFFGMLHAEVLAWR